MVRSTTSKNAMSPDDKEAQLCRKRECDRASCTAEADEQRAEWLCLWLQQNRTRCAALCSTDRHCIHIYYNWRVHSTSIYATLNEYILLRTAHMRIIISQVIIIFCYSAISYSACVVKVCTQHTALSSEWSSDLWTYPPPCSIEWALHQTPPSSRRVLWGG